MSEFSNVIPIKISFLSPFSELNTQIEFKIEIESGSTIQDLLNFLSKKFGKKFDELLYTKDHKFSKDIVILRNGKNILIDSEKYLLEYLQPNQEFVFCTFLEMG